MASSSVIPLVYQLCPASPQETWVVTTIPHLYLVGILAATTTVWFDAADFGALPTIAGRERIVEANSLLSSTASILSILGPSVAGGPARLFCPGLAGRGDAWRF